MLCKRCGSFVPDAQPECPNCGHRFRPRRPTLEMPAVLRSQETALRTSPVSRRVGALVARRFRVVEVLSVGEHSATFRARDEREPDRVVVSTSEQPPAPDVGLQLLHGDDLDAIHARARAALRDLDALDHPALVIPTACGLDPGGDDDEAVASVWIASPPLVGLSLDNLVNLRRQTGQRFSVDDIETLFVPLCRGLTRLHEVRPHGALSAENIILSRRGPCIAELLVAPALGVVHAESARASWLAPECLEGGAPSVRADIFALARVLRRLVGARGDWLNHPGNIVAPLRDLFARALARDPADRFETPLELGRELLTLLGATDALQGDDPAPSRPSIRKTDPRLRRRPESYPHALPRISDTSPGTPVSGLHATVPRPAERVAPPPPATDEDDIEVEVEVDLEDDDAPALVDALTDEVEVEVEVEVDLEDDSPPPPPNAPPRPVAVAPVLTVPAVSAAVDDEAADTNHAAAGSDQDGVGPVELEVAAPESADVAAIDPSVDEAVVLDLTIDLDDDDQALASVEQVPLPSRHSLSSTFVPPSRAARPHQSALWIALFVVVIGGLVVWSLASSDRGETTSSASATEAQTDAPPRSPEPAPTPAGAENPHADDNARPVAAHDAAPAEPARADQDAEPPGHVADASTDEPDDGAPATDSEPAQPADATNGETAAPTLADDGDTEATATDTRDDDDARERDDDDKDDDDDDDDAEAATLTCPNAMELVEIARDPSSSYCIDKHEFPGKGNLPRVNLDADAAASSCEGIGKRLCSASEWKRACGTLYPYGGRFKAGRCNVASDEGEPGERQPAGGRRRCRSRVGAYDMVGNVAEWVAEGYALGGSYSSTPGDGTCGARVSGSSGDEIGFRCCADPEH